jgi:glycerophosphoryl diester phosphodiesterase
MSYQVIEQFLTSKTGRVDDSEDTIVATPHFIGVADGATAKSDIVWGSGLSSGGMAVALFVELLPHVSATATFAEAVATLTAGFRRYYAGRKLIEELEHAPYKRPTVSIAIYSVARREVWVLGDGLVRIGDALKTHEKAIDQVLSATRAVVLEQALADGALLTELRVRDPGRDAIMPMLRRQSLLQNKDSDSPFAYGVLDGFPVPPRFLVVHPVPTGCCEITLATDGYPTLGASLEESEAILQRYLQADPLCFRYLRSTKGLHLNQRSHDDRAYVRITI